MRVISSSGAACETLGLDNASIHDYETGKLSRWTTEEQGMNECFKANLGGVPKGGSVTWTGPGIFAARYRFTYFLYKKQELLYNAGQKG